ncbi:MAG: GlsB/YeaQ/YmgE family stress response membrane protein [Rhizobiaceae bacterium]
MDPKSLIVFLAIGLAAGFLASFVVGGGGLVRYLVTGVIGAFVGGFLMSYFNLNLGIANPLISQIITAAIGAIVVVLLARIIA